MTRNPAHKTEFDRQCAVIGKKKLIRTLEQKSFDSFIQTLGTIQSINSLYGRLLKVPAVNLVIFHRSRSIMKKEHGKLGKGRHICKRSCQQTIHIATEVKPNINLVRKEITIKFFTPGVITAIIDTLNPRKPSDRTQLPVVFCRS